MLEALKPSAMSPALSIAMLPSRKFVAGSTHGALLENKRGGTGAKDFVPWDFRQGYPSYRVVDNKRFMTTEVAVGQSIHQPIPDGTNSADRRKP